MDVDFSIIKIGGKYSRKELSKLWGYAGKEAIYRGVVTPRDDNKIILFIIQNKATTAVQYKDVFNNGLLSWEGPTDHYAERRMIDENIENDEIHVFFRMNYKDDFIYEGIFSILEYKLREKLPSIFLLRKTT